MMARSGGRAVHVSRFSVSIVVVTARVPRPLFPRCALIKMPGRFNGAPVSFALVRDVPLCAHFLDRASITRLIAREKSTFAR